MKYFVHLLFIAVMLASCTAQALEQQYNSDEDAIDKFIESKFSNDTLYTVTRHSGVNRILIKDTSANAVPLPEEGLSASGKITFDYSGYIFDSSLPPRTLFGTTIREDAENGGLWGDDQTFSPITVDMETSELIEGLRRGLPGMVAGGEYYLIFSGKYGFGNEAVNAIPKLSPLMYYIKVISVDNK